MKANQVKKNMSRLKIIIFSMLVVALVTLVVLLPIKEITIAVLNWTKSIGPMGPVVVIVLYILACLLLLPGSILTIGAGFLFGLSWGTVTVSIGSVLGAAAAFLVGRTLARAWIAKKVADNQTFHRIDEAIGQAGFKLVFLLRLSPVFPFNILNYALGLTKVSFWSYFFASWIGMLPGTIMYVYLGSAARSLTAIATGNLKQDSPAQTIFFWVGLAATIVVATLVTRIAQKSLKKDEGVKGASSS